MATIPIVKKAKHFWSWINFIWHILGWFGTTSLVSGGVVAVIAIVGAVIKGLPWPIILMAGYCTLVGIVYLTMAPMAYRVLIAALRPEKNIDTDQQIFIRPHYEAWKHVEKFTLNEAAHLWNDLEPLARGNYTTEVKAWIEAFCAAIRKGESKFIPKNPNRADIRRYEMANPGHDTEVNRNYFTILLSKTITIQNF